MTRIDFVRILEVDVVLKIFTSLDDSADLIRASSVSHYWQHFLIDHRLCKQLCATTYPQLDNITHVIVTQQVSTFKQSKAIVDSSSSDNLRQINLEREHWLYGALFHALTSFPTKVCIFTPISASSTDRYPQESIIHTLDYLNEDSYWSSKGHLDPDVPENLIYLLTASFCLITEIHITPFQAVYQEGFPIYSARFVRFRMGHAKCESDMDHDFVGSQESANEKIVWTYTSQTFPMVQESRVQMFTLPEPVLCIGGYLQIEFLGRVQKQDSDGEYYICMAHVQAIGRQLSPTFSVEFSKSSNTGSTSVSLKYNAKEFKDIFK